jgi:hypothetical protein
MFVLVLDLLNVREYRKSNAKMDNPEKYKQYINLHIFPSTLKDHSLSQKMNDDINIDSIITLSRKQVFNELLVKKGTSVTRTPLKTGRELRC